MSKSRSIASIFIKMKHLYINYDQSGIKHKHRTHHPNSEWIGLSRSYRYKDTQWLDSVMTLVQRYQTDRCTIVLISMAKSANNGGSSIDWIQLPVYRETNANSIAKPPIYTITHFIVISANDEPMLVFRWAQMIYKECGMY